MQFHWHHGDKSGTHQVWMKVSAAVRLFLKVTDSVCEKGKEGLTNALLDTDLYEMLKACRGGGMLG